jgi:hypothetical protein
VTIRRRRGEERKKCERARSAPCALPPLNLNLTKSRPQHSQRSNIFSRIRRISFATIEISLACPPAPPDGSATERSEHEGQVRTTKRDYKGFKASARTVDHNGGVR